MTTVMSTITATTVTTIMSTDHAHTTENSLADAQQLLALMHLSSPALPIGAFAYSSGLESAIETGWVSDEDALESWLRGMIFGLSHLDIPVLLRLSEARAQQNWTAQQYWSDYIRASRETRELLFEDEQQARALVRLLKGQHIDVTTLPHEPAFMAVYALAAEQWGLNALWSSLGYLWSWLENQLTVASKTLPLGQTAAQRLLLLLKPMLTQHADLATTLTDDELGLSLPGQVHASCLHETQYSRLFRS